MKNYLKFWGTRGSCPVSGPAFTKYGGNTACLEIHYEGQRLIIDAGTGIRPLGDSFIQNGSNIPLFIGHPHWDHIIGFPFFAPLYHTTEHVTIWVPATSPEGGKHLCDELFSFEFFPVRLDQLHAKLCYRSAEESIPVRLGQVTLRFHRACHPGVAYVFKIETPYQKIGYATDNEFLQGYLGSLDSIPSDLLAKEAGLLEFFSDCDLLIHEAQYSTEEYRHRIGWGHSSLCNTIALVRELQPKQWLVVHHDPRHTDQDLDAIAQKALKLLEKQKIHTDAQWIGDGHMIDLK